jgi:hypothetical protein
VVDPGEITIYVSCGNAFEPFEKLFNPAVVGIHVLDMVDPCMKEFPSFRSENHMLSVVLAGKFPVIAQAVGARMLSGEIIGAKKSSNTCFFWLLYTISLTCCLFRSRAMRTQA